MDIYQNIETAIEELRSMKFYGDEYEPYHNKIGQVGQNDLWIVADDIWINVEVIPAKESFRIPNCGSKYELYMIIRNYVEILKWKYMIVG